jgi:hypothetical protein
MVKSSSHIYNGFWNEDQSFMTGLLMKHQQRKHCRNGSTDGDVKHSSIQWVGAVWLRKMAEIRGDARLYSPYG